MPAYLIAGTGGPDGRWTVCVPIEQELRARTGYGISTPEGRGWGCTYTGRECPGGGRYRCHREILPEMGIAMPPPVDVRRAVQRAEREEAVAEAPAVVRPLARVGAGIMSVVESVATPRSSGVVDPWSGEGVTPGIVDPWAQQGQTAVAKGMQGLGEQGGPVFFASKKGEVYGSRGKVAEVQKTPSGELVPTEGNLPADAEVVEASVFPVGPWFYAGVGGVTLTALGLGIYFLVKE